MDNQASPVSITYATIPPGYCFRGNDAAKFQQLIDDFLDNGIVNIPGFGQVTPEEIASLNARVQELQNEIDALDAQVRTETVTLAAADTTVSVIFSEAMPSVNYTINIELIGAGTETANSAWYLITDTKTVTGFSIRFTDIPVTVTSFTYIAQSFNLN